MNKTEKLETKEENLNTIQLPDAHDTWTVDDENKRLWQVNEEFADEINRLRAVNALLRAGINEE